MANAIPPDMLLHMDWDAEDKLAAWTFYTERFKQYFMIANTPAEDKVTHIFSLGRRRHLRWTTLKDQLSDADQKDPEKVFTAFANIFEKSSSH